MPQPPLTDPISIGGVEISNRVMLAPLAGIGNWFVRLQARRHGAGMAYSEMVSSFALKYGNERTMTEMLRIHPDEHPVSIQLFGPDPGAMREAAAIAAGAGADLLDINMGCPVPKVFKTGAGAAMLTKPENAVEVAIAVREGSGLPVSVKLRSGVEPGDRSGFDLALRLAEEAGVASLGFHPRPATVHHKGRADYALAAELGNEIRSRGLDCPIVISGGLRTAEKARRAYAESEADAVMIARGSMGWPYIFEELTGRRVDPPSDEQVVSELLWIVDSGEQHWGTERGTRNLRKFYPWYLERIGLTGSGADAFQRMDSLVDVRAGLERIAAPIPA